MRISKSAKNYAKKIYIELKSGLLYGTELTEYIIASVKWDKDNKFHNSKYYDEVEEAVYMLYDKHNRYCSKCKTYKYKGYFTDTKNNPVNVCKECAKTMEVRSKIDNIKNFYDKFDYRKYELITDKTKYNLLQVNSVVVLCKECNSRYTFILNRLLNKVDKDFCKCNKSDNE